MPNYERFLNAIAALAASLGWNAQSFAQDGEIVSVAAMPANPSFDQMIWVCDADAESMRCLLLWREPIAREREAAILELCARVNDGLVFGCLEYSFADHSLAFRVATDLGPGDLLDPVSRASSRLLSLGTRYAPAVAATLAGTAPARAVAEVEGNDT